MQQELGALAAAAVQLPHALRVGGCGSVHYVAGRNDHYPVLLAHGYAATESVWTPLRRALVEAHFGHIISLSYNSFVTDPLAVSAELTHQALRALGATGAPRIHLVGHSLGGLIIRSALAANAALSSKTATAVTIASPHHGASLARIALGPCAPLMHRGPRSAQPETDAPRSARWLAYYSDGDRVVPPASARLDDPRYSAANVLIPGCGHLRICRDARLTGSLVAELPRTETFGDPMAPAGAGRELMAA